MADKDWIDREMAIRQIKHEYSPFDENALENYIMNCIKYRREIDPYAEGLWDAIESLCYLSNKRNVDPCADCQEFICDGCLYSKER
jgi:hypothetical protein